MLYLLLGFALAGTSAVAARFVSATLGPFTITAASLFFALVLLLPLNFRSLTQYLRGITFRAFLPLLMQAALGIVLFRLFFILGLSRTSAAEAGILTGAAPAITAILAITVLRERSSGFKVAGILCSVAGVAVLQGLLSSKASLSPTHLVGNLLVLCAAASESVFNILSRATAQSHAAHAEGQISPMVQTAIVCAAAFLLSLIPAALEHPIGAFLRLELPGWAALIWYGVFVTALAFIFWYAGIRRCGAFTAAAFSGMMPLTALMLSTLLLGEHGDLRQWVGGGIVILGMILIGIRNEPKQTAPQAVTSQSQVG